MSNYEQCPFCGWYEIELEENLKIGDEPVCICLHCQALAPASKWNTRPIEELLRAEIEDLEDTIEKILKLS